jgi:protein TonB
MKRRPMARRAFRQPGGEIHGPGVSGCAVDAAPASTLLPMATPFDLRHLSSKTDSAASPTGRVASGHRPAAPSDDAVSRRGDDRHPVGLAVVVGLHVLLAALLLTARLNVGPPRSVQVALTRIDAPPPPPPRSQTLPDLPKTLLHPAVAPVPDVVVDRPVTIQVAAQPAPAAPPAAAAAPAPAKGDAAGPASLLARSQPTRLNAGAAECRPVYPHIAEREGVTGVTRLRFVVDPAGHVSAQLLESSGPLRQNRRMDEAAMAALSRCPVQVGTDEAGRPVGGSVDVNYKWTID